MADNGSFFSLEVFGHGWFAKETQGQGWFDKDFLDPQVAGGPASLTASHSIGDITQTATLDVVDVALSLTASQAIPAITQSATLALRGALTASQSIPAITQTGTLANRAALTANQSIGAVTQSGAALDQQENLQAAQSIPPITQAATLTNIAALTASQAIGDISQSATLATPASGVVASQPIAAITQAATLTVIPRVEANQPIPAITQAGLLDQDEKLTAAQAIPPITQAATLQGGALAALFLSASQNIGEITQSALLLNANDNQATGGSYADVFGPRKRRKVEEKEKQPIEVKRVGYAAPTIETGIIQYPGAKPFVFKAKTDVLEYLEQARQTVLSKRKQRIRAMQMADDEWLMMM